MAAINRFKNAEGFPVEQMGDSVLSAGPPITALSQLRIHAPYIEFPGPHTSNFAPNSLPTPDGFDSTFQISFICSSVGESDNYSSRQDYFVPRAAGLGM